MKLPKYLKLHKEIGETPLEVLENFKLHNPAYAAVAMSYAGRLDPLASGQLLALVGDECKKSETYLGLDKEYEFEVLFGFSTDTQDLLGLPQVGVRPTAAPTRQTIGLIIKNLVGRQTFPYPAFSSKTVLGKPLFKWSLEGRINEIEIPTKDVNVYKLQHIQTRSVTSGELQKMIADKIESIKPVSEHQKALGNDFRRPVIRSMYQELFQNIPSDQELYILKFSCICSSGTYMRTLAQEIARRVGYEGLAFSITRTKMGRYLSLGPFSFWRKTY